MHVYGILYSDCFYMFSMRFLVELYFIADPLTKLQRRQEGLGEEYSFQGVLEASKKSVIQDSMSVLLVTNELA